jgi:protein TonB
MTFSLANLGGTGGASSPLGWAIAASVALHFALIAGLPEWWAYSPAPATAPLNARLEPGPPATGADALPAAEPVARVEPEPAAQSRDRTDGRPPRQSAQAQRAATLPSTASRRPEPVQRDTTEPEEARAAESPRQQVAAGAARTPVSGEPTLAPLPGDEALDLGSLAQYRLALIGTAKRHRLYPEHAIERGWEGRVTVRLAFGADGGIAAALVHRSSGYGALDREAVDMLRRAAALTPLPPALRSREFSVDVPVLFELRSAG